MERWVKVLHTNLVVEECVEEMAFQECIWLPKFSFLE
jgi:hypothetical protein